MRNTLFGFLALSVICLVFFYLSQRQLSDPWVRLALNPEYSETLIMAMDSQKKLAELDPDQAGRYREQFNQAQILLGHLEVLQVNRNRITQRYHLGLLSLMMLTLVLIGVMTLLRQRRLDQRLQHIQADLSRLAGGETDLDPADKGRDVVGKISAMIGRTSREMARTHQRLKSLENLRDWQETSRRLAHEIRTPLTTLRLEVDRFLKAGRKHMPDLSEKMADHERGIREELTHLTGFTDQFTSFAKIGDPRPSPESPHEVIQDFCDLYADAWRNLKIINQIQPDHQKLAIDRRLVRQVLVNLADNSAKALADTPGTLIFQAEIISGRYLICAHDSGPGFDPAIRDRLFTPYTTTRPVGEGTGLGLAISKKIMLDHGGDLEPKDTPRGAAFQLSFPIQQETVHV